MGGGDSGEPLLGPTTDDSGSSSPDEDDSRQSGMHEHVPEEQPVEPEEDEEPENPSSTPPGGGTGGGPGSGAPVAPPTSGTAEPPTEEPEDNEAEQEEPESPEPEPEPEQPDTPEEEPDTDDDPEDTDDEEDEDDEEDPEAQVTVHSDSWDNVGFGLYPIRYQLKEEYGDQVQFDDRVVPVRDFESPEEMAEAWERDSRRHEMPVDRSVWSDDAPESTEVSNRAYTAARKQGASLATDYIRRLRMAAIAEARNIEDRDTLLELANEVGLDTDQLEEDWDGVHVRTSRRKVETPKTTIHIDGEIITQPGYLHVDDFKMLFEQAGLDEEDPQPLTEFVDEYGPVTVKEIQQVYGLDEGEALEQLRSTERILPVEYGTSIFWSTQPQESI